MNYNKELDTEKKRQFLKFLKSSRLFKDLPEDFFSSISPMIEYKAFKEKDIILKEGESNKYLYFLVEGLVSVYSGDDHILNLERKGDIFGEVSVLREMVCTATVTAVSNVKTFRFHPFKTKDDIANVHILKNVYHLAAVILSDKLAMTTRKARKYESANKDLIKVKEKLESQKKELEEMNEELKESRQKALKANEVRSQFLANIGHEIRTPMNGVLGMIQYLKESSLDDEQMETVCFADRSAQNLLTIINEILDYSKMEDGKMTLKKESFDLSETVDELIGIFRKSLKSKKVEFICSIAPKVPFHLIGDAGCLIQILKHLLNNAVKFTSSGYIALRAELEKQTKNSAKIRFEVVDTGIGISQEAQLKIFDVFFQGDGRSTRKYGGTGLGLSLSRQLANLMEGDLAVISELNHGALFSFTCSFQLDTKVMNNSLDGTPFKGKKVLIASGDLEAANFLSQMLERWGIYSHKVGNGEQVISQLLTEKDRGCPFNLAIIDQSISGIDAESLGCAINAVPKLSGLPLVLIGKEVVSENQIKNNRYQKTLEVPLKYGELKQALLDVWNDGGSRNSSSVSQVLVDDRIENEKQQIPQVESERGQKSITGVNTPLKDKEKKQNVEDDALKNKDESTEIGEISSASLESKASASDTCGKKTDNITFRLLVVDDHEVNQIVVHKNLERLGYCCEVAENGLKCMEMLSKYQYDMILMDCHMPKMDGFETTSRIRNGEAGENNKEIPIIAMTALATSGAQEKCIQSGMNDYLSKPVLIDNLRSVLSKTLKNKATLSSDKNLNTKATEQKSKSLMVFNREKMLDLVMGNEELLQPIIEVYMKETTLQLEKLEQHILSGEHKEASRQAHAIKGASGNVSAEKVEHMAFKIESADSIEKMEHYLSTLKDEFEQLRVSFNAELS